jgi:hypothetical protein
VIDFQPRIRIGEVALAIYVLFGVIGGSLSCFNGEYFWRGNPNYVDPFAEYDANLGIQFITAAAFALDTGIFVLIARAAFRRTWSRIEQMVVIVAAAVAALLTWFELWYGSTFYYGEVRDKQGLPLGVNNGGALGSVVFLTYIVWRVSLPESVRHRVIVRIALTAALIAAHYMLLRVVETPWDLWQS